MDDYIVSYVYNGELQPGEKIGFMTVVGFGRNKTQILNTAAAIDAEDASLFHSLNADQLALIINLGACQSVLANQVTVTIDAPSDCSDGETSDYTVTTSTQRSTYLMQACSVAIHTHSSIH